MKKTLSFILSLCLLLGALCCPAYAVEEELSLTEQVMVEAKSSYRRSLYTAARSTFAGYCGLMVSHQLYNLGINKGCIVNDGNNQFDYYQDLEVTSGGYYPTAYNAEQYSLEEALNAVSRWGTRDTYNVLVGFHRTRTMAGSQYGHAVLINAIIDGMCYFVESFDLGLDRLYPQGSVIVCTIEEFANYFDRWAAFEGIIHFGSGNYSDGCDILGTDVTVQTRFESQLRSQPCLVGEHDCVRVRTVAAGEQLRATGIVTDKLGQRFYRIAEQDAEYYIAAGAVCAQQVSNTDLVLQMPMMSRGYREDDQALLGGTVIAQKGNMVAAEVLVTDSNGMPVLRERVDAFGCHWDAGQLNEILSSKLLQQGAYTLELYADSVLPVIEGGQIQNRYTRVLLLKQEMQLRMERSGLAASTTIINEQTA